jgi:hypothetical protein
MKTYVYGTADLGQPWQPIAGEGIDGFAHVVRQDLKQPWLLFSGTESGLYLTLDGGRQWARFTGNLPAVPVRDIAIHTRESDLIVATHGRGIYIVDDITPLRQLTPIPCGRRSASRCSPAGRIQRAEPARRGINRVEWAMRLKAPRIPPAPELSGGTLAGPMAAEGKYQVKIIKGEETYTSSIELVGDPLLPHSAEDRKLRHDTLMRVYSALEKLADLDAAARSAGTAGARHSRKWTGRQHWRPVAAAEKEFQSR